MSFSRAKRLFFLEANGKSKATLYFGLHLAYHSSMPQTRIPPQILKGSAPLFAVAISSQEAVWFDGVELHGHVKPHSPARRR
jgi:hypothetical protein